MDIIYYSKLRDLHKESVKYNDRQNYIIEPWLTKNEMILGSRNWSKILEDIETFKISKNNRNYQETRKSAILLI